MEKETMKTVKIPDWIHKDLKLYIAEYGGTMESEAGEAIRRHIKLGKEKMPKVPKKK